MIQGYQQLYDLETNQTVKIMFTFAHDSVITYFEIYSHKNILDKKSYDFNEICDASQVDYPDDEHIDYTCIKHMDHKGPHLDEILGEWENEEDE